MRHLTVALSIALLTLSSCANETPKEQAVEDQCGAEGYQSLIGNSIAAITLPAELKARIIGPNDVVTLDYNPQRLNIYTDENGIVIRVACG